MNLNTILPLVAVLACPIGMGFMMWLMNKQMNGQSNNASQDAQPSGSSTERLAALRKQRQMLEAEIVETTQVAELEAQRDALSSGSVSTSDEARI
ncbi:MAG: hypothetical protein ACYDBJ_02855 [Aggregatilineales bacterium]